MKDASRYTKAADGGVVDVASVDPEDRYARGPYHCLSCGHFMVPALGHTRKHHFKHKAGRPQHCTDETYLHQLGKLTLFEALSEAIESQNCFPLTRERPLVCDHHEAKYGVVCSNQSSDYADDLAKRFDRVEMEKGVDGFIADILLTSTNTDETLLLEISVTHRCEQEKIDSGLSIVEIQINGEDDIEPLRSGIDAASRNVSCHNLDVLEAMPRRCLDPCNLQCTVFLLYDSGKAWYSHTSTSSVSKLTADSSLVTWEIIDAVTAERFRDQQKFVDLYKKTLVKQRFQNNLEIRSCMLCRHNGGQTSAHDIRCNYKNRDVWMSSSASICPSYSEAGDADEAMRLLDRNLQFLP